MAPVAPEKLVRPANTRRTCVHNSRGPRLPPLQTGLTVAVVVNTRLRRVAQAFDSPFCGQPSQFLVALRPGHSATPVSWIQFFHRHPVTGVDSSNSVKRISRSDSTRGRLVRSDSPCAKRLRIREHRSGLPRLFSTGRWDDNNLLVLKVIKGEDRRETVVKFRR